MVPPSPFRTRSPSSMHVSVVTDQPWDVRADVLAVPVAKDGDSDEIATELDRRLGGGLADYRSIGELKGSAWSGALLRGSEMGAGWLLGMGVGDSASVDRLAAVRLGASVERRLAGRAVSRLAVLVPGWMLGSALDLNAACELIARGVVEGSTDPSTIYRDAGESLPPQIDELTLVVRAGSDASAARAAAERG